MNQISRICPVTDTEAERIARHGALADLAAQITAVPATDASGAGFLVEIPGFVEERVDSSPPDLPRNPDLPRSFALSAYGPGAGAPLPGKKPRARERRAGGRRRRWLLAAPIAAGVAVAAVLVAELAGPGNQHGPGHQAGPAAQSPPATGKPRPGTTAASPVQTAQALSFTTSDGWITVIVRNPLADEARYRAEFAAHHLDITFNLVPASPSIVGTVVYTGQSAGSSPIQTITAKGRCYTGGGGAECPVGVRIPADFHGQAEIVFGRAARPGEQYESTAVSATVPGEVMHGLKFVGDTVTQVLALLRPRQVTVAVYNYDKQGYGGVNVHHVPGNWYVYDAAPWAPGQVMLSVGPTRTQPPAGPPQPGTPTPSPTG
jgi:hypothetical protein